MRQNLLMPLAAVAAIFAGSLVLPQPVLAQRSGPTLQPVPPQIRVAPGALRNALEQRPAGARNASQQEVQSINPALFGLILNQTVAPWIVSAGAALAAMEGWTPLTNGPAMGGPSVVPQDGGQATVVVRAAENRLYLASFTPVSISGPLPSSEWKQTSLVVNSDVDCEKASGQGNRFACAYLGAGGAAFAVWMDNTAYSRIIPLGGQNGGARPALFHEPDTYVLPPSSSDGNTVPWLVDKLSAVTWDGGVQTYRRHWLTHTSVTYPPGPPVEAYAPELQGWKVLIGATVTPMSCSYFYCLVGSANGVRMFAAPSNSTTSGAIMSPELAAGVSNTTAPELVRTGSGAMIAVVRGNDGRIYQSRRSGTGAFNAWRNEGGAARPGANISCLAINEQPICFIQGSDGRIWFKRFATESGL